MSAEYNILAKIDSSQAKKGSDEVVVYLDNIRKKADLDKRNVQNALDYDTRASKRSLNEVEDAISDIADESRNMDRETSTAFDNIKRGADDARNNFNAIRSSVMGVVGSITAITGVFTAFMRANTTLADDVLNMAGVSGTSASEFHKMAFAASTVGVEQKQLSNMLRTTQRRIVEFNRTGGGVLSDLFDDLSQKTGFLASDLKELSGRDALLSLVSAMDDAGMSSAEMREHLLKINPELGLMLPLLRDNAAELRELEKGVKTISDEQFAELSTLNASFDKLGNTISGIGLQFATEFSDEMNYAILRTNKNLGILSENFFTFLNSLKEADNLTLDQINREISEIDRKLYNIENSGWRKAFDIALGSNNLLGFLPDFYRDVNDLEERRAELVEASHKVYEEQNGTLKEIKDEYFDINSQADRLNDTSEDIANNMANVASLFIDAANELNNIIIQDSRFMQRTAYEIGLSEQQIVDIRNKIKENDLYSFYDTEQQKIRAYIRDNDLLSRSKAGVVKQRDLIAEQKDKIREALDTEISSLQKQIDTYDMSSEQLIKYRAEQGDLAEAIELLGGNAEDAVEQILELTRALSSQDAQSSIRKEVEALNHELKVMRSGSEFERISLEVSREFAGEADVLGQDALNEIVQMRNEIYRQQLADSFISDVANELDLLQQKLNELELVEDLLQPEVYEENRRRIEESIRNAKIEADEYLSFMKDLGEEMRGVFSDVIFSGLEGDWSNMFDNLKTTMNRNVAEILSDQALNQLMNMFSGGFGGGTDVGGGFGAFLGGLFPGRASGGWMHPGKIYEVGERGKELIMPNRNMYVDNMNGSSSNGSSNLNINISGNIDATSSRKFEKARSKISADIAREIRNSQSRGDI